MAIVQTERVMVPGRFLLALAFVLVVFGCQRDESAAGSVTRDAAPSGLSLGKTADQPWSFAVISDLHVQPDGRVPPILEHVVTAVIATRPRFVVITGDFTDGLSGDPAWRRQEAPLWWHAAVRVAGRIRAAGIPVLPLAGNHDSYLPIYRADYAQTWRDLGAWTAPLAVTGKPQPREGIALDAEPFSYAVDVAGVHLALAHVVDEALDPGVARWLERDLANAQGARLRIVFGHVPLGSVAATPRRDYVESFGRILVRGHADAYIAGHEHLVWDDDVDVPEVGTVHQIIVTTASASWRFGPGPAARARARCVYRGPLACCVMPRAGVPFELSRSREGWFETQPHAFTQITIDGRHISARAIAVRADGGTEPFGRATPCEAAATTTTRTGP